MEVAFVVQRYGHEIVGGAEAHARKIAEKLSAELNWQVHVYTTTAADYITWKKHYKEGLETINGVLVHRFDVAERRNIKLFGAFSKLFSNFIRRYSSNPIGKYFERLWYRLQGPVCPAMLKSLLEQEKYYQRIFFFTYLYEPCVKGLPMISKKSVLIPTAHDEDAFYFGATKRLFNAAPKIFVNSQVERELIVKNYPQAAAKIDIVGLGFDDEMLTPNPSHSLYELPVNEAYVLYLGRIGRSKQVDRLVTYFQAYRKENPSSPLKLVLAGQVEEDFRIPSDPHIIHVGVISESHKAILIANARCLANPSPLESLSLVVLEAMALKVPALVNKNCAVLAFYTEQCPTVFGYNNQSDFLNSLKKILSPAWQNAKEGPLEKSRIWANQNFSWKKVLSAYESVSKI